MLRIFGKKSKYISGKELTFPKLFNKVKRNYNEILLIICILFFIIGGLYYWFTGKKGTISNDKFFVFPVNKPYTHPHTQQLNPRVPRQSKGELECRQILEELFKPHKFPSVRPDWLRNPVTGGNLNLELDCYCKELNLAVEYDGQQHFRYIPYLHKNKEAFYNQQYRDYMKKNMCKQNGVILINVPYTEKNIKHFLINQLKKAGFNVPSF